LGGRRAQVVVEVTAVREEEGRAENLWSDQGRRWWWWYLVVALSARIFDALHVCMIEGIHMDTAGLGTGLGIDLCLVLCKKQTSDRDLSFCNLDKFHDFCWKFPRLVLF
jgi:hypothetical protein